MRTFKNKENKDIYFICKEKRDPSLFHYGLASPGNTVDSGASSIYTYNSYAEWKEVVNRHVALEDFHEH